jgi:ribonuclease P protein component
MRREQRLRQGADFERVRANRRSWAHPLLVCSLAASPEPGPSRFGFVVGRRIGNAVTRNRVKRRLREVARSISPRVRPGFDLVFIARPQAVAASLAEIEAASVSLLDRAGVLGSRRSGGANAGSAVQ